MRSVMPLGVTAVMLADLDFDEQLALCSRLGVTHYSLRPRVIPDDQRGKPYGNWGNHKFDLTPRRLVDDAAQIKRKMDDAGVIPFGTVPVTPMAITGEELKINIEGAAAVGAGRMRVAAAPYPQGAFDYAAVLDQAVQHFGRIVDQAWALGVKVVIETHVGSLACSPGLALQICRHFESDKLGVIFDLPNFTLEGTVTANLAVASLHDYIDHAHVGGSQRTEGQRDTHGFRTAGRQMCSLADSDTNTIDWLTALHEAECDVPLVIEDFSPDMTSTDRLTRSVSQLNTALGAIGV